MENDDAYQAHGFTAGSVGIHLRLVDAAEHLCRLDCDLCSWPGRLCQAISARSPSGVTDTIRPSGSAADSNSRSVTKLASLERVIHADTSPPSERCNREASDAVTHLSDGRQRSSRA